MKIYWHTYLLNRKFHGFAFQEWGNPVIECMSSLLSCIAIKGMVQQIYAFFVIRMMHTTHATHVNHTYLVLFTKKKQQMALLLPCFLAWALWQYGLWSFQTGGTKLERFLPKNQHTQRKLLNFENWTNGEPQ